MSTGSVDYAYVYMNNIKKKILLPLSELFLVIVVFTGENIAFDFLVK